MDTQHTLSFFVSLPQPAAINMSTFPLFLGQQPSNEQPPPPSLPSPYRLINAFQDLAPYHDDGGMARNTVDNGYGLSSNANVHCHGHGHEAVSNRFDPGYPGMAQNGRNGVDRGLCPNQSAWPWTAPCPQSVAALCDELRVPPLPNLSMTAMNAMAVPSPRPAPSAVVVTAPPLPAAAIPDALKRSPSPHGLTASNALNGRNGLNAAGSKAKGDGVGGVGVGALGQRFECTDCGKRYKHLSNLRAHAKVHTAEAKVCPFCKKRFGRKANYEEHLRVHTGETPYECKFCRRKFKHRHSWKDHLRIHTGEKPYQCQICNRTFNVRHNLTVHYR